MIMLLSSDGLAEFKDRECPGHRKQRTARPSGCQGPPGHRLTGIPGARRSTACRISAMAMAKGQRWLLAAAVFLLVLAACTSTAGRPGPGTGPAGTPAGSGPAAPGGLR